MASNIDIDASYYKTGTATVAAEGTVVTGTGTQWISSTRAGDLFGTHVGDPVRILSVDSNTQLTLAYPWKGPAQTDAAYEIQFTPYDTGYYPAVRQLLQILSSGNVEALANIDGSGGGIPYFTGSGTMGVVAGEDGKVPIFDGPNSVTLADPTTFGIQDPNGSLGKLAALTLAARQILQTDDTGALKTVALAANKFLRTDANGDIAQSDIAAWAISMLGLAGAANKFPYLNDVNTAALADITALGRALLALNGTNGNIPVMTGAGTVASRPIVGTVSQSGGVPTGAIVEYGGTAVQGYVRFAGGLQICWADTSNIPVSNSAVGNIFRGDTTNMGATPAAFAAVPMVIVGGTGSAGGGWTAQEVYQTASNWGAFSVRSATSVGTTARYFLVAIGRWY